MVHIQVTDPGRSIQPELLPYVIKDFWQTDSSIPRRFGDLGLGLAIAQSMMEMQGGTLKPESPEKNKEPLLLSTYR